MNLSVPAPADTTIFHHRLSKSSAICWFAALTLLVGSAGAGAADWPMWRGNPNHTADSPENLPNELTLRWMREYQPRVPVWEDPLNQDLMPLDTVFEPVVAGNKMFVGFNDSDKLVALDIRTGRQLWTFYADGPVRLAPVVWQGKVYFTSDDGWLYCVLAEDGTLVWKFCGGPSSRKVLGNSRLVSAWPARGGPVIRDGAVYFAASIWPFMGTFIYALDAGTGKVVWVNDGTGAQYQRQPHGAPAFAGVAPQGTLVATEKYLLVPGGRSIPAVFDRATGRFLYFQISESGKGTGGSVVMATETEFYVHTRERGTRAHELATGKKSTFAVNEPVLGKTHIFCAANYSTNFAARVEAETKLEAARHGELKSKNDLLDAKDAADTNAIRRVNTSLENAAKKLQTAEGMLSRAQQGVSSGQPTKVIQAWKTDKTLQWEIPLDGSGDLIRAGNRLYAANSNAIVAIELPKKGSSKPVIAWSLPVQGTVRRLLAANGMLFAVTLEGRILAFGRGTDEPVTLKEDAAPVVPPPAAVQQARTILDQTGAQDGYAFCFGLDDVDLIVALAASSQLQIIGVDADASKVDRLRHQLDAAGLYGRRVALLAADPAACGAPPYIASLVVAGGAFVPRLDDAAVLGKIYDSVRPYGGSLWINGVTDAVGLAGKVKNAGLANAKVETAPGSVRVIRSGALPGAADWTHQYGDVGNSVKSDDRTVKPPVGLLWFGGNTHQDVLPRHGHGPSEQVIGGRLIIEGMDSLSARDVYTGRRLWKTTIAGLNAPGIYYDNTQLANPLTTLYSQRHMLGANARGANFVATEDRVYVAVGSRCEVLDAVTGAIVKTIPMPAESAQSPVDWGYLGVCGDVLLGGAGFAHFNQRYAALGLGFLVGIGDYAASRGLVAFDRHTGAVLWRSEAQYGFLHNGIAAGGGRVYCLDRLPKSAELKAGQRGEKRTASYRIVSFDLTSGQALWQYTNSVFGTWLSYSKERDLLLQAGATATDRLKDEATQGMAVLQAKDGAELWKNLTLKYTGPCILHHDMIITTPTSYKQSAGAYSLLTGKPQLVTNPLTGESQPWRVFRTYGCNTPIASEYLMTFRSGAAGYYDLQSHAGTGNFGGFKSGCSANLIIADGVLNAPDYTRTCSCPYQNQTSLAMVPMPEVEMWTCNLAGLDTPEGKRISRVGVNLGAAGDRLSESGTLWLEYPTTGAPSPQLSVLFGGSSTNLFRRHASAVAGDGPAWVMASGLRNLESIVITPQIQKPAPLPLPMARKDDDDDDGKDHSSTKGAGLNTSSTLKSDLDAVPVASTNSVRAAASAAIIRPLAPARYTVRLYFLEPDNIEPGQRQFDVTLQGVPVLKAFDVVKAAGGVNRGVIQEFKNILLNPKLEVRLQKTAESSLGPVLSGVELVLEKGGK